MPQFGGPIGKCIAEQCQGEEVVSATSLASSMCSSAGVWEPYWMIPSSVKDSLDYAATAVPTSEASSEAVATSSVEEVSSVEQPQETESASSAEPSSTVEETSDVASSASDVPSETPSLVTCYINNEAVAEVDYETGICDFELPSDLDPFFNFVSAEDYNIQYYYARVNGNQFTNDIRSAGRVISIPAKTLYKLVTRVHEVLLQQSAGAQKRDEVDDFLDSVADTDGTDTGIDLSVDVTASSSSKSVASSASAEESVASSASATTFGSDSVSDVASSELPGTITVTETCTDDEGHVTTETVIITSHVTEYCEQTSASAVQSSACDEQSSAKSEQSSASEEQDKVVTTIYSCESAKSSLESVKSSAESAHKTEIVASCESELSSINSVESVAYVTLTSLIEVQESCIAKQTSLAQVQSSAASVQLSAAHAQESSRAVENAESAVAEASKAADEIQTVVEYITLTVENGASEKPTGVVASTITSVSLQTESTDEQSSSTSPAVEIANAGASLTASAFALIVSTGIFFGLLI
ncbi:Cell wall protein 1 [Candida tropicalis]